MANDRVDDFIGKEVVERVEKLIQLVPQLATEINKLITQSEKLEQQMNSSAKATSNNKTKKEELTEAEKAVEKINKDLQKTIAKREALETDAAKAIAREKAAISDRNKELREAIKLEKTQAGSLDRLRAETAKLRKERNALNLETDEGQKRLAELNAEIDKNDAKIKESVDSYTQAKIEVGNYKENITEALKEQDFFGVSLGKLGTLFTTTAGIVGVAAGVVGGLAKAYTSSARGAEDLARATDRLNSISRQIGNSMADATGEVGLLDKALALLQEQVLGTGSAVLSNVEVVLRSQLRQLEVEEIQQERQKKAQLDRTEQLRQIRDEERNSFEERKAANDELADIINTRESETIAFQEKRLGILQKLLNLDKGNIDIQKQIAQVEFEIADAREEAQGFRSEQLANDLALSREFSANSIELTQKQIEAEILATEEGTQERFELEKKLIESTRELQLQAAGDNAQLQQIANQEAENSLKELTDSFKEAKEAEFSIDKAINEDIEKDEQETQDFLLELRGKSVDESEKIAQELLEGEKKIGQERIALEEQISKEIANARIDISRQGLDALFELATQAREAELERLDKEREEDLERAELQSNEDLVNNQEKLAAGLITEEEAAAEEARINRDLANEQARINEEADRREAALKTKQARADKAAALIQIAINTALGVADANKKVITQPLIPFIIAQGAIQAAIVAAQPIPKFWTGAESSPDTFIAGDRGRELMLTSSGDVMLTPDKPTLYSNMEGTKIIPNAPTEKILRGERTKELNDKRIVKGLRRVEKAVGNSSKRVDNTIMTQKGNTRVKKHLAWSNDLTR